MKSLPRKILKYVLAFLSKKTIDKHNAEIIVITGWTGSPVVREMVYHLLKDDYNVRRNTTTVWWDLSVPLTILGYEDRKRNIFEWLGIIFKSYIGLIFYRKHSHKVIINLDSSNEETAKFWSKLINPHIVVVLKERPKSKLIKQLLETKGWEKILFVYNHKLYPGLHNKRVREFIFEEEGKDLSYKRNKDVLDVNYKGEKVAIKIPSRYKFFWEFIPASLSVGILQGLSLSELAETLSSFDLHPNQVQKAISGLKQFVFEDEK